jgi:hypothetical protein
MMGYPTISGGIEMGSLLVNKLTGGIALEHTASRRVRHADVDDVTSPDLVFARSIALLDTAKCQQIAMFVRCSSLQIGQSGQCVGDPSKNIFAIRCSTPISALKGHGFSSGTVPLDHVKPGFQPLKELVGKESLSG